MLRVRDIMTTDLITLDPNLTIREAMDVFASKRISGAPVVGGDELLGVLSASDLIQFAAELPGVPSQRELSNDLLDEGGEREPDGIVPDVDDDPSGVFFTELWDDAGATAAERIAVSATSEWNSLEEHTVSEAMTHAPVHSLAPDTLVTSAAEYMQRAKIHRVLVMTGATLVGVVTTSDITRAVAEGKLTAHTYVFDRQSPPFVRSNWGRRR